MPIVQSLAQLEKDYGEEGAEILQDNCQVTVFGGFAPNGKTAETLSKNTLTVEENALRPVSYACKADMIDAICKKYPNVQTEKPAPEMTPLEVHLQEQVKQPDGLVTKTDK